MKRVCQLLYITTILLIGSISFSAFADFKSGVSYETLNVSKTEAQQGMTQDGKVIVKEFFWYGCPHCKDMAGPLQTWLKQNRDKVKVEYIPAFFGNQWKNDAKFYYTLEQLGVEKSMKTLVFSVFATQPKLNSPEAMADYFASALKEHNISKEQFVATYQGFPTLVGLQKSAREVKKYKINGVPTLIIGNRYQTSPAKAGGIDKVLGVLDQQVAKIQKDQVLAKQ